MIHLLADVVNIKQKEKKGKRLSGTDERVRMQAHIHIKACIQTQAHAHIHTFILMQAPIQAFRQTICCVGTHITNAWGYIYSIFTLRKSIINICT